jgi:hypothetical protein
MVCAFKAGSSVTHKTVASGSVANLSLPSKSVSITAEAMTVLPAPVGALRAIDERSVGSAS